MQMRLVILNMNFRFGFKEVEGIHSRTDFDLKQSPGIQQKENAVF